MSCERHFEFFNNDIIIHQGDDGQEGGFVWDASLVLAKFFENVDEFPPTFFKNKRVLELGSGTGLIGIILALLGAEVIVTDLKPLLPLIEKNINANVSNSKIKVKELNWGEDVSEFEPPFDFIVGSDVVYREETFKLLIKTFSDLSNEETVIFLAHELRERKEIQFFDLLRKKFTLQKIPDSSLDETYRSEDIGIFRIKKTKT
eukprot:TRINITY_DN4774_c0_g1_i1.p1 TRINITY_DN4774_c0_g1~~TRINITY_DN4774_c0_g1_i1.p1  ORF type:complete len:203 (+),score=33.81 TRINITY_DN4774_c0_g1_i1:3-611(+)